MFPLNQSLKIGALTGLILVVYTAVIYAVDANIFTIAFAIINGLVVFGFMIFAAVMGMRRMRDLELDGKFNYLQALVAGFVVFVVALYINGFFSYVLNGIIDPEYLPTKMDMFVSDMEGKIPEAQMEEMVKNIEEGIEPVKALVKGLWMNPLIAVVLSAIVALFVKKDTTLSEQV
ncbi:MAG: DUF4199 domain-containing protein [Bacteroidetes bacterium]|nr:DUF4199 domain-containing protein [Bacteroidales bacterium]MBS4058530.1 DUF4199 domain-containing protein [Bacteroidales bacterium]MBU1010774.1 DUF4199 domain-containing protein [Bacteroidota bacterium]